MNKYLSLILILIILVAVGIIIPRVFFHDKINLGKFNNCVLTQTKKTAKGFLVQKVVIDSQDKQDAIYTKAYTLFGIPFGTYKVTHLVLGSDNACNATVDRI